MNDVKKYKPKVSLQNQLKGFNYWVNLFMSSSFLYSHCVMNDLWNGWHDSIVPP